MVYDADAVDALLKEMEAIVERIAAINRSIPDPLGVGTIH